MDGLVPRNGEEIGQNATGRCGMEMDGEEERPDHHLLSYCCRAWSQTPEKHHSGGQMDRYGRPLVETWQVFLLP